MTKRTKILTTGAGCLLILSGILAATANAQDTGTTTRGQNQTRMQGRMNRGGPASMAVGGDYIYILRANVLTQYSGEFKELNKITFENERQPGQGGQGGQGGAGGNRGNFQASPAPQDDQPPVQGGGFQRQGGQGGQGGMMPPGGMQGMPGMGMMGGAPGLAATANYVYVLRGTSLMQLSVKDLKVTRRMTVETDRPANLNGPGGPGGPGGQGGFGGPPQESAPQGDPQSDPQGGFGGGQGQGGQGGQGGFGGGQGGFGGGRMQMMPGMMGGAPCLAATTKYVYVLGGTTIRIYSAETLEFIKKVALATETKANNN